MSTYPQVEAANKRWRIEHATKTALLEHPDNCKSSKTQALGHRLQPHALRERQQDAADERAGAGAVMEAQGGWSYQCQLC